MPHMSETLELVSMSIARRLAAAIREGQYPLQSRLPAETDLARQFGASRASVREALLALQFAGYVESRRGSGTVVRSIAPDSRSSTSEVRRRPIDHLQLLEARLVLEPQTIALGACDPEPAALRLAGQLIDGMALSVSAPEFDVNTDLRVHSALVETCRNSYLVGECQNLLEVAASDYYKNARSKAWEDAELLDEWVQEHRRVWEAVARGDAETAMRASREHLLSVVHRFASDESLAPADRARMQAIHARFGAGVAPVRAYDDLKRPSPTSEQSPSE